MSRVFTDENLQTWEAYASAGDFGLPDNPKVVFNNLSEPDQRARFVVLQGAVNADAEEAVHEMPEEELLELLRKSSELD